MRLDTTARNAKQQKCKALLLCQNSFNGHSCFSPTQSHKSGSHRQQPHYPRAVPTQHARKAAADKGIAHNKK